MLVWLTTVPLVLVSFVIVELLVDVASPPELGLEPEPELELSGWRVVAVQFKFILMARSELIIGVGVC